MIKCQDIINFMENIAPLSLAYNWDNCGFICGDNNSTVKTVMFALDLDLGVLGEAIENGVDMIVTHHPAIFSPLKRVTIEDYEGRLLTGLIHNNIAYYAAHTNLDAVASGLNDFLANKIGLPASDIYLEKFSENTGIGRIFNLETAVTMHDICALVKEGLAIQNVQFTGNLSDEISKIALCSGSGEGILDFAIEEKCDVLITGDFRYDKARMAYKSGVRLIVAGHYETEHIVCELLEKRFFEKFGFEITTLTSKANKPIFHLF